MIKFILLLILSIVLVIFYHQDDFNDFMREIGIVKMKCGESFVGMDSEFIRRNLNAKQNINGIIIHNIPENMKSDIEKNSHGDIVGYLKSNDFNCRKYNNTDVKCTLQRQIEIVPAPSCKKGTKVMYSKGEFIIDVFVKSLDSFDVKYDFTTSK